MITQPIQTPIYLDTNLKDKAIRLFERYDISLNEALNIFLQNSIDNNKIPFDIQKPNKETLEAMWDTESGDNYEIITLEDLK